MSDTAGLYRLANGEEITSNVAGQADRFRSLLKAINRGDSPQTVAQKAMQIAGTPAPISIPRITPPDLTPQMTAISEELRELRGMLTRPMPSGTSPSSITIPVIIDGREVTRVVRNMDRSVK